MSPEAVSLASTYPEVFVVLPSRGGSAGWASLAATNTADKALLQHREPDSKGGVLARLDVIIFQPARAVIRWVKELLWGPQPKPVERPADFVLPGLQGRNLLTPDTYAELLGNQGGLTLALKSLELISLYGRASSAEDAWDLLEAKTEGVSARDWARGSRAAVRIVEHSDEIKQFFLADDLNQFAVKACGVIQRRNEESTRAALGPNETQALAMETWLGPDNSQERLHALYEGVKSILNSPQGSKLPWPASMDAGLLLGKRFLDFDMKVWIEGGESVTKWFEYASFESKARLAADLNGWADKAAELLFESAVEQIQFYGYASQSS